MIEDLEKSNLLKIARLPEKQEIAKEQALFLIDHDYPALTPKLWNSLYEKLGQPERRAAMMIGDPTNVRKIMEVFRQDSAYIGGGLGVGFKDEAVAQQALDELHPLAERIGAANVVVKEKEKLIGYNTDGIGYVRSLEEKLDDLGKELADAKVLLLGAGGTASAIAFTLVGQVKRITILNRTLSKAEALFKRLTVCVSNLPSGRQTEIEAGDEQEIINAALKANVIINTTLKGATGKLEKFAALGDTASLDSNLQATKKILSSLSKDTLVSDVNLTFGDPPTIALAKQYSLPTLDGRLMVLYQAIEAFWLVNHTWLEAKKITKDEIEKLMRQAL